MSVLARRVTRAFYYFNRAKPDMRKSNEVRFPNEHGSDTTVKQYRTFMSKKHTRKRMRRCVAPFCE